MSKTKKIGLAIFGTYVLVLIVVFAAFGKSTAADFKPQNEFKIDTWVHIAGPLVINKAVLYLFIAAALTVGSMVYIANRMAAKPNRVQAGVEALYALMRDNITRGNMDDAMARKWFPYIASLFLFIWFSNLVGYIPLPTNTGEKFTLFGAHIPAFAIYAATANVSIPLTLALITFVAYNVEGIRKKGLIGYLKALIPAGITGAAAIPIFLLEFMSNFMRLISLTVRLFANILAGHLIILFMAGGLGVLLGAAWVGWLTMPLGVAIFMFEVVLVAALQAFIFAPLSAIYLGGAVADHH